MSQRAGRRTKVASVHKLRTAARIRERKITKALKEPDEMNNFHNLAQWGVPDWANGARVRPAGRFQHVVEATEWKGT